MLEKTVAAGERAIDIDTFDWQLLLKLRKICHHMLFF